MSKENLVIFLENLIFTVIYIFFAEFLSNNDPLFLKSSIHFTLLYFALLTLYNGFYTSIIPFLIIVLYSYFNYDLFPYLKVLELLIFVLLFGEFYAYWNKKIYTLRAESEYLEKRNRELGRAFFTLKISHDQLEKSYVTKPVNIRSLLEELKAMNLENENKSYNLFLSMLAKYFAIEEAGLFIHKNISLLPKAYLGDLFDLNLKDPLVKNTIDKQLSSFVSDFEQKNTKTNYLAVIPAISSENKMLGLLVIKQISFMAFNRENIQIISILFSYFLDEITFLRLTEKNNLIKNSELMENSPFEFFCDYKFVNESKRLSRLKDRYNIISSIVLIKIDIGDKKFIPLKLISSTLRQLDIMSDFKENNMHFIFIIMPLTSESGVIGFTKRVNSFLKDYEFNLKYYNVEQYDKLKNEINKFIEV